MNEALQNLEIKVENGGTTPQGRLTSSEWNILVAAVKALDADSDNVDVSDVLQIVKDAGYAKQSWVTSRGYLAINKDIPKTAENAFGYGYATAFGDFGPTIVFGSGTFRAAIQSSGSTADLRYGYTAGADTFVWRKLLDSDNFGTYVYTKTQINETIASLNKTYITLAGEAQSITAQHDFTNGLLIDGLAIKKSRDKAIYIDGNLVVSGAITMFGKDSTTFPTIWASIPFDSTMKWDGSKWSVVGGGMAGSVAWSNITDKPTWIGANKPSYKYSEIGETPDLSLYATQSWVTGKGYITSSGSITGNAATASKLRTSISLWGNSFNGSADVNGIIDVVSGSGSHYKVNGKEVIGSYNANYFICDSAAADGYRTHLVGKSIAFQTSTNKVANALLDESGNFSITGVLKLPAVDSGFANPRITFGATKVRIGATTAGLLGVYASGDIRINPNSATSANSAMGLWLKATGLNGVNNSSPTEALDVVGNILASGTMRLSTLGSNAFNNAQLFFGANDARIGVNSSGTMAFYARAFLLRPASSATGSSSIGITIDTSSNILTTGAITMYYSSDKRLKQNIRKINASEALMSLGGVYQYEYIDSEVARNSTYGGSHYGLIYQNVKGSALDKMCHEREDGMGTLNYLDTDFISLIAGATMENISEIELVKRENRELRKELEQLKQRVA